MFQCPVCGEFMEALTNLHCLTKHHTNKKDLLAKYGSPRFVMPVLSRDVQRWLTSIQVIRKSDFELSQYGAKRRSFLRS